MCDLNAEFDTYEKHLITIMSKWLCRGPKYCNCYDNCIGEEAVCKCEYGGDEGCVCGEKACGCCDCNHKFADFPPLKSYMNANPQFRNNAKIQKDFYNRYIRDYHKELIDEFEKDRK